MSNITDQEIQKLEGIMLGFGEAHNLLAKTSLSKDEYQPISGLLAKAKVELFNFYNAHKAALQNKVSDISAEGILDIYYKPKMHWKVVNRKNVLAAMHEYASIVNERRDSADWISVEDRLPEFNINVLALSKKGRIIISCVTKAGELDDFELEVDNGSDYYTHWMPLPAPPVPKIK